MKVRLIAVFLTVSFLTGAVISRVSAKEIVMLAESKGIVTVEEVFANKAVLKGTKITVKGEVVKFNSMIMGKNWVHIQDGSGKPGSNDLTATTNDNASVGDKVVVTGTLIVDKDFGAGYKYAVILEDATIAPQ